MLYYASSKLDQKKNRLQLLIRFSTVILAGKDTNHNDNLNYQDVVFAVDVGRGNLAKMPSAEL